MRRTVQIFYISLLFFALNLQAQTPNFDEISETLSVQTQDNVLIKGVRLKNEGGTPIILVHGFMENTRTWREMAYEFYKEGHDVFMYNMRGHGNGEQMSQLLSGSPEKYNFDRIVAYDIPAMIDHTYKTTGKKAYYVGHSMGTMSGRLTLSGVRQGKSGMEVSQEAIEWGLRRIKGAVAIASPTTFETNYFIYRLLKLSPNQFLKLKKAAINLMIRQEAPYAPETNGMISSFIQKGRHVFVEKATQNKLVRSLIEGVLRIENLNPKELEASRLFYKGLSNPPLSLAMNAQVWFKSGYKSLDGNLNYDGLEIPKKLKYVYVGGGHDRLAHPGDILKDLYSQGANDNLLYALYPEFSHVDLISGRRGGTESARLVDELIQADFDYKRLNPAHSLERVHFIRPEVRSLKLSTKSCHSMVKAFLK